MAFGRLRASDRQRPPGPMGEINMTPLIDVMLVLLVIFIITAPLIGSRLALDLPTAEGAGAEPAPPAVLPLAIDAQGQLYLDDQKASAEEVQARARRAAQLDPQTEVQLRADQRVPYGRVAELIATVQRAGLSRIGLVTEAPAQGLAAPATAPR